MVKASQLPKGSMYVYGIYLGPKEVPIYLLQGPNIYHIATWTGWVVYRVSFRIGERSCVRGFQQVPKLGADVQGSQFGIYIYIYIYSDEE